MFKCHVNILVMNRFFFSIQPQSINKTILITNVSNSTLLFLSIVILVFYKNIGILSIEKLNKVF